ncbi:MAG: kelch repeat-containing protein, partial [Planctomycetota bacterium]
TNPSATALSSSAISVQWTDTSDTELGFEIYRSTDGVNFLLAGTADADVEQFLDGGLDPETQYFYKVRAVNLIGASADTAVASATTLVQTNQAPFAGAPVSVPGNKIQAEDYDTGGQGTAYNDLTPGNSGGVYRFEDVDLVASTDNGTPVVALGGLEVGEWFEYTIDVTEAGLYEFDARVASNSIGGAFHVEIDTGTGFVEVTDELRIRRTRGDDRWQTIHADVNLTAGEQVVRIVIDKVGKNDLVGFIDWFRFRKTGVLDWTETAKGSQQVTEAAVAVVGSEIFRIGGYNENTNTLDTVDAYNPVTNTWRSVADLPKPLSHVVTASSGNTIYLASGWTSPEGTESLTDVWAFDAVSETYTALPSLPAPRAAGGVAVVGNYLYFFGGVDKPIAEADDSLDHGDTWRLDLTNTAAGWQTMATMPNARNSFGYAVLGERIYVVGGQYKFLEDTTNQTDVHAYDPSTNTWTQVADLPTPRGHITSSVVAANGKLLVIGGAGNDNLILDDVIAYDPVGNSWSDWTSLPEERRTAVAGVVGNTLVTLVGRNNFGRPTGGWTATLPPLGASLVLPPMEESPTTSLFSDKSLSNELAKEVVG